MRELYDFSTPYWNVVLALQLCGVTVLFRCPATDDVATQLYDHGHLLCNNILLSRIYFNILTAVTTNTSVPASYSGLTVEVEKRRL